MITKFLGSLLVAAVTNSHKCGDLNQQKFILSLSQRQSLKWTTVLPPEAVGGIRSLLFPGLGGCGCSSTCVWPPLPALSPQLLPSVCLSLPDLHPPLSYKGTCDCIWDPVG